MAPGSIAKVFPNGQENHDACYHVGRDGAHERHETEMVGAPKMFNIYYTCTLLLAIGQSILTLFTLFLLLA